MKWELNETGTAYTKVYAETDAESGTEGYLAIIGEIKPISWMEMYAEPKPGLCDEPAGYSYQVHFDTGLVEGKSKVFHEMAFGVAATFCDGEAWALIEKLKNMMQYL